MYNQKQSSRALSWKKLPWKRKGIKSGKNIFLPVLSTG